MDIGFRIAVLFLAIWLGFVNASDPVLIFEQFDNIDRDKGAPVGWTQELQGTLHAEKIEFRTEGALSGLVWGFYSKNNTNQVAYRRTFISGNALYSSGTKRLRSPSFSLPPNTDFLRLQLDYTNEPLNQFSSLEIRDDQDNLLWNRSDLWAAFGWQKLDFFIPRANLGDTPLHFSWTNDDHNVDYRRYGAVVVDNVKITSVNVENAIAQLPCILDVSSTWYLPSNTFTLQWTLPEEYVKVKLPLQIEYSGHTVQVPWNETQVSFYFREAPATVRIQPIGADLDCPFQSITREEQNVVSEFPYVETFDNGPGNWVAYAETNQLDTAVPTSWKWGTVESTKRNVTAPLPGVWSSATLVGDYGMLPPETSYLVSPMFDFINAPAGVYAFTANISFFLDDTSNQFWSWYDRYTHALPDFGTSGRTVRLETSLDGMNWSPFCTEGRSYSPFYDRATRSGADQADIKTFWDGQSSLLLQNTDKGENVSFWAHVHCILQDPVSHTLRIRWKFDSPQQFSTRSTFLIDNVGIYRVQEDDSLRCPASTVPAILSPVNSQLQLSWTLEETSLIQPLGFVLSLWSEGGNFIFNQAQIGYTTFFNIPEISKYALGTRFHWTVQPVGLAGNLPENSCAEQSFTFDYLRAELPYYHDFESLEKWTVTGENPSWVLSDAAHKLIRGAGWTSTFVTTGAQKYHNMEKSYLVTPEFDARSHTQDLQVTFQMGELYLANEGVRFEVSVDRSNEWNIVGTRHMPESQYWYNWEVEIEKNVTVPVWSIEQTLTHSWIVVPGTAGRYVSFRFVMQSDYTLNTQGFAIDDFFVSAPFMCSEKLEPQDGVMVNFSNFTLMWEDQAEQFPTEDFQYRLSVGTVYPYIDIAEITTNQHFAHLSLNVSEIIVFWSVTPIRQRDKNEPFCQNQTGWVSQVPVPQGPIKVLTSEEYFQDFETTPGGWMPSGIPWALGETVNGPDDVFGESLYAWSTSFNDAPPFNEHRDSEFSVELSSPIFDFSDHSFDPILEFSWWVSTPQTVYGFNVQMSLDNGETWSVVGSAGSKAHEDAAENWYSGGLSNPPDGSDVFVGWYGYLRPWARSAHFLTGAAGNPQVQIRYAFKGPLGGIFWGFGVDNIKIKTGYDPRSFVDKVPLFVLIGIPVIVVLLAAGAAIFWLVKKAKSTDYSSVAASEFDEIADPELDTQLDDFQNEVELDD